jgi:hypothetical protein
MIDFSGIKSENIECLSRIVLWISLEAFTSMGRGDVYYFSYLRPALPSSEHPSFLFRESPSWRE